MLLAGCTSRPRAPALEDGAVYANDREGLRFLVPDGWSQQAKADVPPGPVVKERVLVLYRTFKSKPPASFTLSLADLPEETNLSEYLAGPSVGVDWHLTGPPEPIEVGGAAARRFVLSGRSGNQPLTREVVAVPRGARTYFFSGNFGTADKARQEHVRGAVASVRWLR